MSYTYADRRRTPSAPAKQNTDAQSPAAEALRSGAAAPTQEQMGRRVDLPDAMRAKMEASFGADLSAVKLYESEAVADAGAEAVTQGSNIAFAPGMLDFSSFGGQSLLGHEISHVVSQARGEVTGGGFLSDHALEARADQEGAMAAAGEQIAAPTATLSPVSAAAAAGPMQAKKQGASEDSDIREKIRPAVPRLPKTPRRPLRRPPPPPPMPMGPGMAEPGMPSHRQAAPPAAQETESDPDTVTEPDEDQDDERRRQ